MARQKINKKKIKRIDTEAAQSKAIMALEDKNAYIQRKSYNKQDCTTIYVMDYETDNAIATFNLKDIVRKREPLRGVKKAFRKLIQPRRKK